MEEDNTYTEVIDWLQCEICSIWVHRQCVKAPLLLNSDTFLCEHVHNTLDNTIMYNKIYNSVNCMVNTIN